MIRRSKSARAGQQPKRHGGGQKCMGSFHHAAFSLARPPTDARRIPNWAAAMAHGQCPFVAVRPVRSVSGQQNLLGTLAGNSASAINADTLRPPVSPAITQRLIFFNQKRFMVTCLCMSFRSGSPAESRPKHEAALAVTADKTSALSACIWTKSK